MKKFLVLLVIFSFLIFGLSCEKKAKVEKVEKKVEEQVPVDTTVKQAPVDTTQVQEAPAGTTSVQAEQK